MRRRVAALWFLFCGFAGVCNMCAQKSVTAQKMERLGFVNVGEADSTLRVSLMYARPDNFLGRVLYKDLREAYLHPKAAKALLLAQKELRTLYPELSLIVFDAARPMHIQQQMWNAVAGTEKKIYVCNPRNGGGLHNYGMAVDVSLFNIHSGDTLDMGTKVDFLGRYAHIDQEEKLVADGVISPQARANRLLLRRVMRKAGFVPLKTEWWHFNFISRAEAKAHYKAIP